MRCWQAILAFLAVGCSTGRSQSGRDTSVTRLMTYNIQWFSEEASEERINRIKKILLKVSPDIVGLQEIQSKRALLQVFGNEWQIGIKDDPNQNQELAIAVRKPFVLVSANLVFEDPGFDIGFPEERDALRCVVQTPSGQQLVVYVVHMKSRRGGRIETDPQRVAGCGLLAAYIRSMSAEKNVAVVGDFNDAPNDQSLQVLESGDLMAKGGGSDNHRLLTNLMDPLWRQDFATLGVESANPGQKPRFPGAKADNDRLRGRTYRFPDDVKVTQALFDQILVSQPLSKGATTPVIFLDPLATEGESGTTTVDDAGVHYESKGTRASDHLPVFVDIKM
ncbi:MAG: endonuclease/exonuclease/phosphatase family protein [Chthonomonadaceae bacterium]|nr:endonuclease/exonuclease/phosphatase family protein [Chthonomonadaceae bacterium]